MSLQLFKCKVSTRLHVRSCAGVHSRITLPAYSILQWMVGASSSSLICACSFKAQVNTSRKAVRFDEESGPYLKEFADPARNNRPAWYTWIQKAWKEVRFCIVRAVGVPCSWSPRSWIQISRPAMHLMSEAHCGTTHISRGQVAS